MRLLLLALLCLVADPAKAEAPFTPPGVTPPDYAATKNIKWTYLKPNKAFILHHDNWTRVAATDDFPNVTYYPADDGGRISVGLRSLTIVRGPEPEAFTEYAPRNTGERQTHLGESCTVWEVSRNTMVTGLTSIKTSCVTDDGIELWWKSSNSQNVSSGELTQLERRPVSPENVRPPASAFALNWPDRDPPPVAQAKPDHELVMVREKPRVPDNGEKPVRTVRRHGPWQLKEETYGQLRTIDIDHDSRSFLLRYSTDKSGAPKSLVFWRSAPAEVATIPQAKADRNDTVLGETCRWLDMTTGAHGGLHVCLTEDGIALKETSWTGTSHLVEWTAIRLTRRPIAVDEIKPPADLLLPKTWGVE